METKAKAYDEVAVAKNAADENKMEIDARETTGYGRFRALFQHLSQVLGDVTCCWLLGYYVSLVIRAIHASIAIG